MTKGKMRGAPHKLPKGHCPHCGRDNSDYDGVCTSDDCPAFIPLDKRVYPSDGAGYGTLTGGRMPCRMEGCGGMKLGVRWPEGKLTYPCNRGMDFVKGSWRIM